MMKIKALLPIGLLLIQLQHARANDQEDPIRVFIFAGQSNMVGSDSRVEDIDQYPPYRNVAQPDSQVKFSYCIGRENKLKSDGWVPLQPVNGVVGPELSFAHSLATTLGSRIAIIKVAAGGTHLGGDWNPDDPSGFRMYPLLIQEVKRSLALLDAAKQSWRLEGFMWHQGENDMFNEQYMEAYGENLSRFMHCIRRDLNADNLPFYVGELCTKTIWGMDLRPRMHAISVGQKAAVARDQFASYIPTSQVAVEIGGGVGLHYHYGTLGQLEHGTNYANAYLESIEQSPLRRRSLAKWPFKKGEPIRLIVMAGHRNMEGERSFHQQVLSDSGAQRLLQDRPGIPFRYSLGGGVHQSDAWEPLGLTGYYDTFGPELSFARTLLMNQVDRIAIAKFTHSGSQMIDWTPEGSVATTRNLYPAWIQFVRASIADLKERGHPVELAAVVYHVGENDMSFGPFRKSAPDNLRKLVQSTREDLAMPSLLWIVSQQPPTTSEGLDKIDVVTEIQNIAKSDPAMILLNQLDLPIQEKQLVLNTEGIIHLGVQLGEAYIASEKK